MSLPWPPSPQCQHPGQKLTPGTPAAPGPIQQPQPRRKEGWDPGRLGWRRADEAAGPARPGQAPPAPRGPQTPGSPPAHAHTHTGTHMCIYPQSHTHTHTHRHTPSPKWLIIAVKKPHPTLGVSRPHAAEAARANAAQGLPAPGPELNPQKSPGPPAQVQGLEWCRVVASDRHGSRGDTRNAPGRAQGHGPAAPDTNSPQGQADACTHTSSMPPGGQNQAGGPEGRQALARHEGAPHPLRTISEKRPPEQDGGPRTTWPPGPSPSSVHPQPHPGPAPTQTEGPEGSPPRPCVEPDHPAGPNTRPPPALAARPRDQLPEEPLPRQGLPVTGQDAGPSSSARASAILSPETQTGPSGQCSRPV